MFYESPCRVVWVADPWGDARGMLLAVVDAFQEVIEEVLLPR
jgi:hypothetical protein